MQERYFGDEHDFVKFAMLNKVNRLTDLGIGVNWYRTDHNLVDGQAQIGHGEKRKFLSDPKWQGLDDELREKLKRYENRDKRRILDVIDRYIIPESIRNYYDLVSYKRRSAWHAKALQQLGGNQLIFLDPDTGFIVPSARGKETLKYVYFEEAADYFKKGASVIVIQFTHRHEPFDRGPKAQLDLLKRTTKGLPLPILRAPNVEFVGVAHDSHYDALRQALATFAESHPRLGIQ